MDKKYICIDESLIEVSPMTGPYHHFLLLQESKYSVSNWQETSSEFYAKRKGNDANFGPVASLSDDFLCYISDQVSWVNSKNPAKKTNS